MSQIPTLLATVVEPGIFLPAAPSPTRPSAVADLSDETLLFNIARKHHQAFDQLHARYGALAFAVAFRMLKDRFAAEDAVQTAFLAVWRRANSYQDGRGPARAWILTIVRNAATDQRRGSSGRHARHLPLTDSIVARPAPGGDPFSLVAKQLSTETVWNAIALLPPAQRAAIELSYFSDLSHREIAERTGVPLGTVKGRVRIGLRKLRESLTDRLPPERASAPRSQVMAAI